MVMKLATVKIENVTKSLVNVIRGGIKTIDSFLYDDNLITIRALSSYEIDQAKYGAMELVDQQLASFIIKVRLGELKNLPTLDIDKIPKELYKNYLKYDLEFDYWVVYYSMKDFIEDDTWSIEDVRLMHSVHELAEKIISITSLPHEVIKQFVYTDEGKRLATAVYVFHQPLNSDLWKMTPTQEIFLALSHPSQQEGIERNNLSQLQKEALNNVHNER